MGGGPSVQAAPTPTPAPPPPDRTSSQVADAAAAQRARYYGAQGGRSNTFLGGGDDTGNGNSRVAKTLGNVGR